MLYGLNPVPLGGFILSLLKVSELYCEEGVPKIKAGLRACSFIQAFPAEY